MVGNLVTSHHRHPKMKQKHTKKKRKRNPQAPKTVNHGEEEKNKVVKELTEALSSVSVDDAVSAYREAKVDPDKAAEILGRALSEIGDDPSTSSTSGEGSTSGSGSSEGFVETSCVENLVKEKDSRGNKQKRVVAATGTVSTVLGKEYMMSSPRRDSRTMGMKLKGFGNGVFDEEKAEQFLCSMLGEESELNLAIVRDVLC